MTAGEPTPGQSDVYPVGIPKVHSGRYTGQTHVRLHFRHGFLVSKRTNFFSGGFVVWMLHSGGTRHPGPARDRARPGYLSVEL